MKVSSVLIEVIFHEKLKNLLPILFVKVLFGWSGMKFYFGK